MFIGAIIGAVGAVGAAALNRSTANRANAQNQANMGLAGKVDYTTISPAARTLLDSLLPKAGGLASDVFSTDFNALRNSVTGDAVNAAVRAAIADNAPGLKSAMGKAGSYNSTAYETALTASVSDATAKNYFAGVAAANERVSSQMSQLNPLLTLLGIDKGSVKVGKEATGAAGAVQDSTNNRQLIGDVLGGVSGILGLGSKNTYNTGLWGTKGPGE